MNTTSNSDCCGGCGETDGNKRCIGCMHPFSTAPIPTRHVNDPLTDRKADEIMERGYQLTGYVLRHPTTSDRVIIESSAVRWVKADDMAKIMFPQNRQPRQPLTDERISDIASSMPGGLDGFCKGWGWRSFARAIEAEINKATT